MSRQRQLAAFASQNSRANLQDQQMQQGFECNLCHEELYYSPARAGVKAHLFETLNAFFAGFPRNIIGNGSPTLSCRHAGWMLCKGAFQSLVARQKASGRRTLTPKPYGARGDVPAYAATPANLSCHYCI